MTETRTTRNLKHTSIRDHLLNNKTCIYSTIDHTPEKTMLDTKHLSITSANALHHDQKTSTNNDDQHFLIEASNDSIQSIDNNQQKLARIPSRANQYSSTQTTGKKGEDAGKWLDHIFEVIEQQELTLSEQRDIAARRLTDDALLWYRLNRLKMPDMQCFI
ncbi:unnamed protein product [Rotaria sp. Silwood2]|nr:unnamed protein product [Rotaria sp. Silwood2]